MGGSNFGSGATVPWGQASGEMAAVRGATRRQVPGGELGGEGGSRGLARPVSNSVEGDASLRRGRSTRRLESTRRLTGPNFMISKARAIAGATSLLSQSARAGEGLGCSRKPGGSRQEEPLNEQAYRPETYPSPPLLRKVWPGPLAVGSHLSRSATDRGSGAALFA